MIARLTLTAGFGVLCVFAFIRSFDFPDIAGYFPLFAGGAGMVLAAIELVRIGTDVVRSRGARRPGVERDGSGNDTRSPSVARAYFLGWAAAFMVLVYLFGAFVATLAWVPIYGIVGGRIRWRVLVLGLALLVVALYGMYYVGFIEVPIGVVVS